MKTAYLDMIGGIAGDMTLAAFVSAGYPLDDLSRELRKLPIHGFELSGEHITRNGIDAVRLDVVVSDTRLPHRHLNDIVGIIDASDLSARVKQKAKQVFGILAEAEARIHRTTPEKVHFHEIGAVDAVVDIVGAAICVEAFGIEKVFTSPVKTGTRGSIRSEHGILPNPAPATLEILRGYPVLFTPIPHELTTPTGAAIVRGFSSGVFETEQMQVEAIGYGAGKTDLSDVPNLLRVVIGETDSDVEFDEVMVIETNIDDMNPEIYPYVIEKLLVSGAIDAYLIPTIMKKGRPGIQLSVLARRDTLDRVVQCLHSETSSIGVRIRSQQRRKLPRESRTIDSPFGRVTVKLIRRGGKLTVVPEFEECRRIAEEHGIPLITIYKTLEGIAAEFREPD